MSSLCDPPFEKSWLRPCAVTAKKCTKKIAVNILLFRRSSCCRLSLLRSPVFCSLDPIQSTLFEHGEWLSKLDMKSKSKNAFVTVISTRLKLQTVQVSFPWNLILGTKPKCRMDCVNCVYVLHKTSGQGILRSSRAATVKKCTKKIAVRKKLLFYLLSTYCFLDVLVVVAFVFTFACTLFARSNSINFI